MTKKINSVTEVDVQLVNKLWDNEECPYFDLIMYGDGRVFPLSIVEENSQRRILKSISWVPISKIAGIFDRDNLNEGFAALFHEVFSDLDLKISCGECFSRGENGFVAVTKLSSKKLVWLAFFVESNPFESIIFEMNVLLAKSTDGKVFRFQLDSPDSVEVSFDE